MRFFTPLRWTPGRRPSYTPTAHAARPVDAPLCKRWREPCRHGGQTSGTLMADHPDRDRLLDWPRWMRGLGRQMLRVREFLGLSQEELARMAGVSQGAVSRLENGRGLATPLLVVMRVSEALHSTLSRLEPASLSPEARRIASMSPFLPGRDGSFLDYPISEPGMEDLLRIYRSVPPRHRSQLLLVLRATAAALGGEEDEDVSTKTRA